MRAIDLRSRRCTACTPNTPKLSADQIREHLGALDGWSLVEGGGAIVRELRFPDYYQTMAFVNAVAYIAHSEDHHPDLEVSYNRCRVRYSTHAIGGLSDNDFICAAKVDGLVAEAR